MAWGRVPIVGNVKLIILSERVVPSSSSSLSREKGPFPFHHPPHRRNDRQAGGHNNERLIVRWKTCGKTRGKGGMGALYRGIGGVGRARDRDREQVEHTKITEWLGRAKSTHTRNHNHNHNEEEEEEDFCGMFIFEFDEEGRVLSHTIEHVEGELFDEGKFGLGGKVVSVTEWLLGRMNGNNGGERGKKEPALALEFGIDAATKEEEERGVRRGHGV